MAGKSAADFFDARFLRRDVLRAIAFFALSHPWVQMIGDTALHAQGLFADAGGIMVSQPLFSAVERNRRWEAIRAVMAKPQWNLDALIFAESGDPAYGRYVTQIGGRGGSADVIFPRDGAKAVYAFTGSGRNRSFWSKRLATWTHDGKLIIREGAGSRVVAEQLTAMALAKPGTRIGLAKLVGSRFHPEGTVSATFLENLRALLPGVQLVPMEKWGPDAGPIDEPAMVKSAEEREVIRRCVAAGEKAIQTIAGLARASAKRQADLWFGTFTAMFLETGEDPTRLSISLDEPANSTLGAPVEDPVKQGQIISQEIDATVQGYRAQVNHSIFTGGPSTPGFDYYILAMETAIKALLESMAFIIPAKTTCGQLVDRYAAIVDGLNAEDRSGVVFHGSGIGNLSRPRLGPNNSRGDSDIVLVPGMAFDFKPALRMKRSVATDVGRENRTVQIGEHFLIADRAVIRVGKRDLKPIATETR